MRIPCARSSVSPTGKARTTTAQDGVTVRPIQKTDEEYKADIISFIREHTETGVSLKELLAIVPSRAGRQVRYLLRVMKKNGLIEVNGHGNSAR